jgi:hypothetical protein
MMTGTIRQAMDDGVAVLTLADPGKRNALSNRLSQDLAAAVGSVLSDGARAIVLDAEPPVFCAGGSLDDLLTRSRPLGETYAGFLALAEAPVPTIAAVTGPAIGAGVLSSPTSRKRSARCAPKSARGKCQTLAVPPISGIPGARSRRTRYWLPPFGAIDCHEIMRSWWR